MLYETCARGGETYWITYKIPARRGNCTRFGTRNRLVVDILPTYLNASGWTRDESRFTLRRILEAGIEPCEGDFFSGATPDANGILRQSRRHKVFVFLEEDIYEFLPTRLNEIGRGLLQVQVTNPDTTKKASKLDVYPFNTEVAGIIERVKRKSHKKHR